MEILVKRLYQTNECTIGSIYINGEFKGFTLEDIFRPSKVKGKTRIPGGTYKLQQKKVLTNLTQKYRRKFKWFNWHIELQDVPNFSAVYIHIGNTCRDTHGCLLVGTGHAYGSSSISSSTSAYIDVYKLISNELEHGKEVYLTLTDEESMTKTEEEILDVNQDGILDLSDYELLRQEYEIIQG